MLDFLYTLIIFPIETVISLFYGIFLKMFEIHGIAIILLSATVNIMLLPLYNVAEKWQQTERDLQNYFKPKLDDIKAVFKGSERHMIIRTYYRQNNYHPVYSLRNVIGLAIQIPFFIAAYHLLSHMPMTAATSSYYFISDLRLEDALLNIGGISVNLLPIVMTAINLLSAFVYSEKLQNREKKQLVIMAFIFLALLYKSPSGLVFYWTLNNIFSLVKNIVYSRENPGRKFYYLLIGFSIFIFGYSFLFRFPFAMKMADLGQLAFKNSKIIRINLVTGFILVAVFAIPYVFKYLNKFIDYLIPYTKVNKKNITYIFLLSSFILFFLSGFYIPSLLLAASPLEFTEKIAGVFYNPSLSLLHSGLQAFAIFVFIPGVIYLLFSERIKKYLSVIFLVFVIFSLVNIFVFPGSYGVISPRFTFDSSLVLIPGLKEILLNFISLFAAAAIGLVILKKGLHKVILNILVLINITLVTIFIFNVYSVNAEYKRIVILESERKIKDDNLITSKFFNFSKTGENVFVVMLDRSMGGLMGAILKHNPEFIHQLSGFTWYSNTVSFNGHTVLGVPGIWGGYEYTPLEMNKRDTMTLKEKHNEALLMMPKLFLNEGYEVNVSDPSIANYSWIPDLTIYEDYPDIRKDILVGKFSEEWIRNNIQSEENEINNTLKDILNEYLINFSFFRIMPNFTRQRIYDGSRWLKPAKVNLPLKFINHYSVLDKLPQLTGFDAQGNTFNSTGNETTHEPFMLDLYPKEFFNSIEIDSTKVELPFSDKRTLMHFYTQIGALKKFIEWFEFLKENNVYDNTKIVIVGDHGRDITDPYFSEFSENEEERNEYTFYHPLLLYKDFDSNDDLEISKEFMTNADVPTLATSHIENAKNPFTGNLIAGDQKKDGVDIVTIHTWKQERNRKYKFNFSAKDIIRVKDNIFLKENWTRGE